jgi:hypothetical protein
VADQRRYQAGMVDVQTGADKTFEMALLELRKLRAHMQLTFDHFQEDVGREKILEMARNCRAELVKASETYDNCESFEKKQKVDHVLSDVDFELERWHIRQNDLKWRLKVRVAPNTIPFVLRRVEVCTRVGDKKQLTFI